MLDLDDTSSSEDRNTVRVSNFDESPVAIVVTPPKQMIVHPTAPSEELVETSSDAGCADMLETVDSCVNCMNQVSLQQEFEEDQPYVPLPSATNLAMISAQALTDAGMKSICLEVLEASITNTGKQAIELGPHLPDIDLLNLCGSELDELHQKPIDQECSECGESAPCVIPSCCEKLCICRPCIQRLNLPVDGFKDEKECRCPHCDGIITSGDSFGSPTHDRNEIDRIQGGSHTQAEECVIL